jgi:phytoene dehydrogenase-like protein
MRVCVIGAGHNGLVAANVLAEGGLNVDLFESRGKVGGMAETLEFMGVKVSRASYVLGLMPLSLVSKFGIPTISQDPFQTLFLDGQVMPFWRDHERRRKELSKLGLTDYEEFDRKLIRFKEIVEEKFTFLDAPPSLTEIAEAAEKAGVEEVVRLTSRQFLRRYLPRYMHRAFIYPGMEDAPAYLVAYFFSPSWSIVPGGMGTVAKVLAERATSLGVRIRLGSSVSRIVENRGKVKGVEAAGKFYQCEAILSSASPVVTWQLLGETSKADPGVGRWVKYNMVLRRMPTLPQQLIPFSHSILDLEAGELLFHSVLDGTMGGTVASFMGDMGELEEVIPDLKENLLGVDVLDASKAEVEYNIPGGNLNHLPMRPPYLFDGRPGYRTEIEGLYMGGAGSYPGGQVTGIPGFNSATALLRDWKTLSGHT